MALLRKVFCAVATLGLTVVAWGAPALAPTSATELAAWPVLEGGRIKPADTVARVSLMRFGGRSHISDGNTRLSASQWLWKLTQGDKSVDDLHLFRIDHPELKTLAGHSDEKFFSYNELVNVLPTLAQAASGTNPQSKDPYDQQLMTLVKNLLTYYELKSAFNDGGMLAQPVGELTQLQKARVKAELRYNQLNPLFWAQVIYALVFVGLLLTRFWPKRAPTVATWLMVAGLALHLVGIAARMFIQERPPVTNLYSSAIFIGAAAVFGTFIIERFLKNQLGLMLGAIVGFVTLQISDKLAQSGDTLEMMRAVLDSNFWLSTHVIVVTIGYSAMFLAGGIAALMLVRHFWQRPTPAELTRTSGLVYGTVCAALLFSFIGTMLGGIWADQSWGRFWGWDPKENGALMIVLWSSLILHARLAGWAREYGTLVLALAGNIVTAWSWFGTNLLGVGLHSYGFTNTGLLALELFVIMHLALMAAGVYFGLNKKANTP